jgi:hypothetical protein
MTKAPRVTVVRSIEEQLALGEARSATYLAWRKAVKEKAPYEVRETLRWAYEDIQDQFDEYAPDIQEGWF